MAKKRPITARKKQVVIKKLLNTNPDQDDSENLFDSGGRLGLMPSTPALQQRVPSSNPDQDDSENPFDSEGHLGLMSSTFMKPTKSKMLNSVQSKRSKHVVKIIK